ncbi:hypothetical protein ACQP3J_33555, partial [Escherichia coli]
MNVFKVVKQITTIEGKLSTFCQDNKKGAWRLKSFPSKGSGCKNTLKKTFPFQCKSGWKTEQLQRTLLRK